MRPSKGLVAGQDGRTWMRRARPRRPTGPVFRVGEEIFLVLEYVEEQRLRDRVSSPVALDRVFEVAGPCVEALSAAHQAGIVHLDIKPKNGAAQCRDPCSGTTSGSYTWTSSPKTAPLGVATHVPEQLSDFVMRLMSWQPETRHPNAQE